MTKINYLHLKKEDRNAVISTLETIEGFDINSAAFILQELICKYNVRYSYHDVIDIELCDGTESSKPYIRLS